METWNIDKDNLTAKQENAFILPKRIKKKYKDFSVIDLINKIQTLINPLQNEEIAEIFYYFRELIFTQDNVLKENKLCVIETLKILMNSNIYKALTENTIVQIFLFCDEFCVLDEVIKKLFIYRVEILDFIFYLLSLDTLTNKSFILKTLSLVTQGVPLYIDTIKQIFKIILDKTSEAFNSSPEKNLDVISYCIDILFNLIEENNSFYCNNERIIWNTINSIFINLEKNNCLQRTLLKNKIFKALSQVPNLIQGDLNNDKVFELFLDYANTSLLSENIKRIVLQILFNFIILEKDETFIQNFFKYNSLLSLFKHKKRDFKDMILMKLTRVSDQRSIEALIRLGVLEGIFEYIVNQKYERFTKQAYISLYEILQKTSPHIFMNIKEKIRTSVLENIIKGDARNRADHDTGSKIYILARGICLILQLLSFDDISTTSVESTEVSPDYLD